MLKKHACLARDFILDLIFPKECLGCGREGVWLCEKCFTKIPLNIESFCLGCGRPVNYGRICRRCRRRFSLDGVWVASDYKNKILADLIKNFKYHFAKEIKDILSPLLFSYLRNLLSQQMFLENFSSRQAVPFRKDLPAVLAGWPDKILIIPIPLHKRRQRWRGFNQAVLLAREVGNKFGLFVSENQLIRVRGGKSQTKLKEAARLKNIRGCFHWRGTSLEKINIILVDDIVTTGATLNEAAKILKKAGAKEVWGLVVAKG